MVKCFGFKKVFFACVLLLFTANQSFASLSANLQKVNMIKSIIAETVKDKTQISIMTAEKPIYKVTNENNSILITVKNAGFSKPVILNTSKLVEKITTNIEKNNCDIKVLTNNAHIDTISNTDNSISVVLSPQETVENLNITSKQKQSENFLTDKKVSFNIVDANLQDVLRIIAKVAKMNIVIGDSVKGEVTMSLMNTPLNQALNILQQEYGLVIQKKDNTLIVNTLGTIAKITKQKLEATKLENSLNRKNNAVAEIIKLNYISPDYAKSIIDSLLYNNNKKDTGFIVADKVNNVIICYDTPNNIKKIENIVKAIDIKKREVEISAKVVLVNKGYERDLGIQWGGDYASKVFGKNSYLAIGGGTAGGTSSTSTTPLSINANTAGLGYSVSNNFSNNYAVNAPAANQIGNVSLMIGNVLANYNLGLQLSLAQLNNYSKTLSSPKIITLDNQEATIESGQEIPYTTITTTGSQSTSFKNALLSLKVTPHITNNGNIIMQLDIADDSPGSTAPNGELEINKNDIKSTIIVKNGHTIAIGGVYTKSTIKNKSGIPYLEDIPLLGWLFKSTQVKKPETKLFIFITPKIL